MRDEQPLLFHAGLKGMVSDLNAAVATLIDPATLRDVPCTRQTDQLLQTFTELKPAAAWFRIWRGP